MGRSDDELTEMADELLLAAPEVEPPAGFEDRVLARIQHERRSPALVPARRRVPVWLATAAAAVCLVIGLAGGALLGRSTEGGGEVGQAFRTVRLISAGGADVGHVNVYAGPPTWIFMQVEGDVVPDGTYSCVLEMDDGHTVPVGRLWAVNGHGGWGEHVDVDARRAKLARVLDRQGTIIATATLG